MRYEGREGVENNQTLNHLSFMVCNTVWDAKAPTAHGALCLVVWVCADDAAVMLVVSYLRTTGSVWHCVLLDTGWLVR